MKNFSLSSMYTSLGWLDRRDRTPWCWWWMWAVWYYKNHQKCYIDHWFHICTQPDGSTQSADSYVKVNIEEKKKIKANEDHCMASYGVELVSLLLWRPYSSDKTYLLSSTYWNWIDVIPRSPSVRRIWEISWWPFRSKCRGFMQSRGFVSKLQKDGGSVWLFLPDGPSLIILLFKMFAHFFLWIKERTWFTQKGKRSSEYV